MALKTRAALASEITTDFADNTSRSITPALLRGDVTDLLDSVTINEPWANLASATTTDLGAQSSSFLNITGTTTITSFGTVAAGVVKFLKFAAALTLTNNATSLILPGSVNRLTAAGDTAMAISEGSGNWRVFSYQKASGKPVVLPAAADITDSTSLGQSLMTAANQAAAQSSLGLGTAALKDTGTSGATVPLLNAANTWLTTQTFTVAPVFTNAANTRSALGLVIGTNVQAWNPNLEGLSSVSYGLGNYVNLYSGSLNTWSALQVGATGQSLIGATNAAGAQSTLGIGTAGLKDTGTSGNTVPLLDGINTWSAAQTWTANPTLSATTAGTSTVAPTLILFRNVAIAGATTQNLGAILFQGQDSTGATTNYGRIFAAIDDSTDTAETGRVVFQTMQAGTLGSRVSIGLGLYTLNRSDQGLNTINATTLYEADVSLVTKYGALASANVWTAVNTFSSTAAASTTSAPTVGAYRNSATVAAGNAIGMFASYGNNSLIAQTRYTAYATVIDDPTAGAETAHILFQTLQAGANGNRVLIGLGLYTSSRSDQGVNTINATTLYESDVALAGIYASLDIYRRLTADAAGSNGSTAQPWFPSTGGVTLAATTLYEFEGQLVLQRTAGTTSHTISILFGGTATLTDIGYVAMVSSAATNILATDQTIQSAVATAIVLTAANTSATEFVTITVKGMVSINGAGTFIPQFKYSAAPGGAPTVLKNSFFKLTKLGLNTSDHFGTWA